MNFIVNFIGLEYSSLGPGLAYLYGTFGYTVGKLVGQYSDSDRVSHSQQSLPTGDGESGVLQVQGGEREGGAVRKPRGEEIGSVSESHCGD